MQLQTETGAGRNSGNEPYKINKSTRVDHMIACPLALGTSNARDGSIHSSTENGED